MRRWIVGLSVAGLVAGAVVVLSGEDEPTEAEGVQSAADEKKPANHRRARVRQDDGPEEMAQRLRALVGAAKERGDDQGRKSLQEKLATAEEAVADRRVALEKLVAAREEAVEGSPEARRLLIQERSAKKTLAIQERSAIRMQAELARARPDDE